MKNGLYFTLFPNPLQVRLTRYVYEHPNGNQGRHEVRAAIADERKRKALRGQEARDNPHVEHRLEEYEERHPKGHEPAKPIAGLRRDNHSANGANGDGYVDADYKDAEQ